MTSANVSITTKIHTSIARHDAPVLEDIAKELERKDWVPDVKTELDQHKPRKSKLYKETKHQSIFPVDNSILQILYSST